MKNKEPNNTGPPKEKQSTKGGLFKSKKETPTQAAKRFESNLPDVAKRNNIRVSSPYGYYPEDVDKVITTMENELKMLQKENDHLTNQLKDYKDRAADAQTELTKLKMQVAMMEVPPSIIIDDEPPVKNKSGDTNSQNKIIKTPPKKPTNITIINSPKSKTDSANTEKPKKGPAVVSLNLSKKE